MDVRLADTDNSVWDGVYFVLVHVLLLSVNSVDHGKTSGLPGCQFTLCFQKLVDVFSVPTDILKLLPDCFAELFVGALFALCQIQSKIDEYPIAVLYSNTDSRPNCPVNVALVTL